LNEGPAAANATAPAAAPTNGPEGSNVDPAAAAPRPPGQPEATSNVAGGCRPSTAAPNLAVGGTATASHASVKPSESAAAAFDDNTGTKFQSPNPTPWIAYELPGANGEVVTTYMMTAPADAPAGSEPSSWQFQGSNDRAGAEATNWTTLDTRANQISLAKLSTRTFSFANTKAYRRYRLLVTANGGGPQTQLAELQFFGEGTPVFSVDDAVRGAGRDHFQYSSKWEGHTANDSITLPVKYGLSSSWSRTTDESVTFLFTGSRVKLFGVLHTQHGIAGISLDGGPETEVDLYGPLTPNHPIFTSPVLCVALHSLKIRVTGKKNPASAQAYVSIDRAQVIP
jgi:hypothetical protein